MNHYEINDMDEIETKWAEDECNHVRQQCTQRLLGGLSIDELPEERSFPHFPPVTDGSELSFPIYNPLSGQFQREDFYHSAFGKWVWVGSELSLAASFRI